MVKDYRKKVGSKTGGIKLHSELKQDFILAGIKIGRDKFYSFLRLNNLLIPKTKNYATTTNSNHMYKKYNNLVKDHVSTRPEQLWVSDITYIKTENILSKSLFIIRTDVFNIAIPNTQNSLKKSFERLNRNKKESTYICIIQS